MSREAESRRQPPGIPLKPSAIQSPAPGTQPQPPHLPIPLTSLIGREQAEAELRHVAASTRLLTLTGPGGCGKTRLALQVAAILQDEYPDGVWLVELAALNDPTLVTQTAAFALGIREQPPQSLSETLLHYLRSRQMLLVLDNCEHLVSACAELVALLLRGCPHLQILATSREALQIGGEVAWPVPPLAVPPADTQLTPEQLLSYAAAQLFVERARAVRPGFAVTAQSGAAIARICRRLDGIPLAIELAAARTKLLPPAQLAAQLDDCFALLSTGDRSALPRHRTLEAAIDWSYALLDASERTLLRRLSVFAGGWSLEVLVPVCGGAGLDADICIDVLGRLVDKSLVTMHEVENAARYSLLETVRQYSAAKLAASSEERIVRERHAAALLALAERIAPQINGPERRRALRALEQEHDNLRAALRFLCDERRDTSLRLASALWWFWFHAGYWREGRSWLDEVLALDSDERGSWRARALTGAGLLAFARGEHVAAAAHFERSIALSRANDDRASLAYALAFLVMPLVHQDQIDAARPAAEESIALFREQNDRWGAGIALVNQAIVAEAEHAYGRAARLCEASAACFREAGDSWALSLPLRHLGYACVGQGDLVRAATLFKESLALCYDLGERWFCSMCLEDLAGLAAGEDDHSRAAELLGAAAALRDTLGAALRPLYRADYEQGLTAARAALGAADFAAAWERGRAMSVEDAIAAAAPVMTAPGSERMVRTGRRSHPAGLTDREIEVLRLVARGLTNAEVAAQLVIAPRTVNVHLTSIYGKLGVSSRTAATRVALEQNLI